MGKSSAVKRLRPTLARGAIVEVDQLRGMIAAVRWTDKVQHLLSLELAAAVARRFVEGGYVPVVVVDTFSGGKLATFRESLGDMTCNAVGLWAAPEVLAARVAGRPSGQFKDFDVCLLLNDELREHCFGDELLDTTSLSINAVAAELARRCGPESDA